MITQDLGIATAYGYAKSKGYTGTEAEFAELMASYASTAQTAIEAADRAVEANTAAQSAKTSAQSSASTASTAAQTATSKASEAVTAAGTATTKASEANTSAQSASQSAESASTSAQTATTAATTATTKASEASESATTASTAKTDAETARDAAAQSALEAAASAESIDPDEFDRKIYAAFATDTATGSIASFPDGADNIPMKDVLVHIEPVQEGSGDPSPENVRPITGWTGAKVTRTGKNLLDEPTLTRPNNQYFLSDLKHNTDYVFSTDSMITGLYVMYSDSETRPDIISNWAIIIQRYNTTSLSFNSGTHKWYMLMAYESNGVTVGRKFQLELGSTATDYEPYSGQTYDITFPIEAGTVYGGTLDVTSGVLTVDRAMVNLGTLNWNVLNGTEMRARAQEYTRDSGWNESYTHMTSNVLVVEDPDMAFANRKVYDFTNKAQNYYNFDCKVPENAFADANAFKTWLNDIDGNGMHAVIVIPMATPITYQLTPQEITSLLGMNNLWADTGGSDVEYRADTKLYITKKITEAVSALS